MNQGSHLQGNEFDWFAVDAKGQVALFATAGAGFIPDAVLASHAEHECITDNIESPNWGTKAVWDDYAKLGLYVFDWDGRAYQRKRVPSGTAKENLLATIQGIKNLPTVSVTFEMLETINRGEDIGLT